MAPSIDKFARRNAASFPFTNAPPPPQSQSQRSPDEILKDPSSDLLIDFNSEQGFRTLAKKKKTKTTPVASWSQGGSGGGDGGGTEKGDGQGGENGATGGSGAGDGGDDGKKNGGRPPTIPTDFGDMKLDGGSAGLDENPWGNPDDSAKPAEKENDLWGLFGGVKKKKKPDLHDENAADKKNDGDLWGLGAKAASKDKKVSLLDEPAPEKKNDDDFWGSITGGEKKKEESSLWGIGGKKKKGSIFADIIDTKTDETEKADEGGWGIFGKRKKVATPVDNTPKTETKEESMWDSWGGSKGKVKAAVDLIQLDDVNEASKPSGGDDGFFNAWGKKNGGKWISIFQYAARKSRGRHHLMLRQESAS